jgi:hypothetical protein
MLINVALWIGGVALMALGYTRARGPLARYQSLKDEDANASRYNAWRGGVRANDSGTTGASVAMAMLRRQAQIGIAIGVVGFVLVLAGFLIK